MSFVKDNLTMFIIIGSFFSISIITNIYLFCCKKSKIIIENNGISDKDNSAESNCKDNRDDVSESSSDSGFGSNFNIDTDFIRSNSEIESEADSGDIKLLVL